MATQNRALNGDEIPCREVPEELLEALGLDVLPNGLLGLDTATGLVEVQNAYGRATTKMRIGKLLKRLKYPPDVQTTVGDRARKLSLGTLAELRITSSSEEVIHVYENGPHSCMSGEDAVRVYNTEDVAVAYAEVAGKILARAVVCKNTNLGLRYDRIYGVEVILKPLLEKAGFEHTRDALSGCKVLRIQESDGAIVMPYIDGGLRATDAGDYMTLDTYGDYGCGSTNGYLEQTVCESCEDIIEEGDMFYSEHTNEHLCVCCYEKHHVLVDGTYYHKDYDEIVELEDGNYVLQDEAVFVDYREEWHAVEDCYLNSYTYEYVLKEDLK